MRGERTKLMRSWTGTASRERRRKWKESFTTGIPFMRLQGRERLTVLSEEVKNMPLPHEHHDSPLHEHHVHAHHERLTELIEKKFRELNERLDEIESRIQR